MRDDPPLRIFGVDASTGRPLAPVPAAAARRQLERAARRPRPPRYGVAGGDLASAGWGVVFSAGVGAAARDALEPLLARRRRQAGERYRELAYRAGEGPTDFRGRLRAGLGRVDPRQVPWYLLLVGDPAELPHAFELDLDVPHAVGRLAFESADDLAAYAERVVASEAQRRRPPRAAIFAPLHPDDPPTRASTEDLARPLAGHLERRGVAHTSVIGAGATRAALLDLLAEELDLVVVAGHSSHFPKDHEFQRERQGAVLCADWPGPEQWPRAVPPRHTVTAGDLPPAALAGGIAILFGCHTAGTPRRDPFDGEAPGKARELTSEPFVAALAQRLLGRDGGALAVVGHVGRAFEASFLWRGVRQLGPFEDALDALLDGRRLGEALDGFGQRFADLAVSWTSSKIDPEGAAPDPLELWVALHDARSWSLLGDPAVRLAVAASEAGEPPRR